MIFDENIALSIQPSRNHCQTLSATIARDNTHMAGHAGLGWLAGVAWVAWGGLAWVAWGGLGSPWDDFTTRNLPGIYPGSTRDLPGIRLGMLGWDGWLGCLARWTLAIHDLLKNFMVK